MILENIKKYVLNILSVYNMEKHIGNIEKMYK